MPSFDNTSNLRWALGVGLILAALEGCSGTSTQGAPSVGGSSNGGSPTGGVTSSTAAGGSTVSTSTGGSKASSGGASSTGGANATGGVQTGGMPTAGGSPATGGAIAATGGTKATGGMPSTGGSKATTGGTMGAGGTTVATGGISATGGMTPGTGGKATGGSSAATGGKSSGGASAATGGTRATGGATGAGGGCQKGQVKASEVLFIGDSFIALNRSIPTALQTLARNAGVLGQSETYRDNSVSGTTLQGTGQIPSQYTNGVNSGAVKVVLMDGGGNDCLQRNDAQGAVAPATTLFQTMATDGTQYVVYFFYPDPQNNATLKTCIDTLRPLIKNLCDSLTTPKCYFIDLRPVFAGNYSTYILSDGIHPTTQGGAAVAQAVWDVMQANCIAQ